MNLHRNLAVTPSPCSACLDQQLPCAALRWFYDYILQSFIDQIRDISDNPPHIRSRSPRRLRLSVHQPFTPWTARRLASTHCKSAGHIGYRVNSCVSFSNWNPIRANSYKPIKWGVAVEFKCVSCTILMATLCLERKGSEPEGNVAWMGGYSPPIYRR